MLALALAGGLLVAPLVALAGASGTAGGDSAPERAEMPAAASSGEVPLPYVRGPSAWEYRSNFGPAAVRLYEDGVQGSVRRYTWSIVIGPLQAGMTESLRLSPAGLFVAARQFHLAGVRVARLDFESPELVIPAPLEVGRRWRALSSIRGPEGEGSTYVEGEVEALEAVDVPAGRYVAYRIHLRRRDSWGGMVETVMWLDPEVGVVKAEGWFRWPGVIGAVQRALNLDRLHVELAAARIRRTTEATVRPPPPPVANVPPPRGGG